MRLNAYLARAGVASRRGADELIKAGRVRVNGEPGRAEHVRRRTATRSRSTAGRSRSSSSPTCSCTSRPGSVTTARDPQGRPTVVGLVPARAARRPGRPAGRGHDGSAPAHERRPRLPTGSPIRATRWTRSTRRRSRATRTETLCAASPRASSWTTAAPHLPAPAGSGRAGRADHPRGPQAPGEADVRGGRPPGPPSAPKRLRRSGRPRPRARRVARADPRAKWQASGARRPLTYS